MKIKSLIICLPLALMLACNAQKTNNSTMKTSEASEMNSSQMAKSHIVKLKKDELFLALVGFQMPGKETLLQEYFGIVFPPAQKHGFTPLGQLPIDKIASGNFTPNEFVGLFKWPNMESVKGFMSEVSPEKLAELRVEIWSELKQHMIMVTEDMELTFKENKVYEVKMIWTDSMIDASKISSNGGNVILNNPVAGYEDLGKNKAPNNLLIIEWDSKKSAESFKKMNLLKFDKEEAFYTHFAFPENK